MVSVVWLIEDASGPVQLHRSAIVTALAGAAPPSGVAGSAPMTTPPATASRPIDRATVVCFIRESTCTPLGSAPCAADRTIPSTSATGTPPPTARRTRADPRQGDNEWRGRPQSATSTCDPGGVRPLHGGQGRKRPGAQPLHCTA